MLDLEGTTIASILSFAVVLTILEIYFPAMKLPKRKFWWPRVFGLQMLVLVVITLGVSSWEYRLQDFRIVNLTGSMSPFVGGVLTYFVGSFVFYWWHRARHEFDFLWRAFHQMHHCPSRIQAVTAFFVHPLEAVASSLINAVLVLLVFGLSKESLIWNGTFMAFAGVFYHMNLSTPRWVGFFLQRPEMHRFHHELNQHRRNYADLPIWDMIFGTYWNPKTFEGVCGFPGDAEYRFGAILIGTDVNADLETEDSPALAFSE